MKSGETGGKLASMIKKAIRDLELSTSEHEEILALASEDGHVDAQERNLLKQLQEMISSGAIKRVPG